MRTPHTFRAVLLIRRIIVCIDLNLYVLFPLFRQFRSRTEDESAYADANTLILNF